MFSKGFNYFDSKMLENISGF